MKCPPALKVKTERSPHRFSQLPQTPPTPHYPSPRTNSWLMNALFVLRPAKLWAFNIGHPCPSLAKGELLLLSQAQPTIEGSPPRLSSLPQTPPTPHYPSPRTTQNPNLPPAAVTTIIHYSSFIIHYSSNKKSAPFQTTDLDIKFQCKIKVCHPPVT